MRLDRILSNLPSLNRQDVRQLIASGRVRVDGLCCRDSRCDIRFFNRVELDDQIVQAGRPARYFMLNKPIGVVSATEHPGHQTVIDLLNEPDKHELHLAGRLDLNTSGLLLITNDGQWSRRVTQPTSKQPKVYWVSTEQPIEAHYIDSFAAGMYFKFEDLTTLPARLEILATYNARLWLHEGRYHQVKRMFGHFQNKVTGLHRERIGAITLDPRLTPGQYRALTADEIASV
ncbi:MULTISPECIES: pseudouridine synthase [Pseudomonas]|uniref:Pseudouridine synthase n=1 Tax=Pseudomonas segetis TaxID=298908 RepID=A0A238Z905_9PSED|nr:MULTISPECIES: pseudouridine synthase [Pseudomonas]SNR79966.1 ribosomal small subunit pseudouridine synthase A [Pseudomonas segetis]